MPRLLVISLVVLLCSCDKTREVVTMKYENGDRRAIKRFENPDDTLTYLVVYFWRTGDTSAIYECYDGARHGKYTRYYESGRLKEIGTYYKAGHIDTTKKYYDLPELTLKEQIVYEDTSYYGKGEIFYENGDYWAYIDYYSDQRHGEATVVYPSGLLYYKAYYYGGAKYGSYNEWYDNFHDSVIGIIDSDTMVWAESTRLKYYKFYHNDSAFYERHYDTNKVLVYSKGDLLCQQRKKKVKTKVGRRIEQIWNVPKVDSSVQYYIMQCETLGIRDTFYADEDSTYAKWTGTINEIGEFDFEATAFLQADGKIDTDTAYFKVIVEE